MPPSGFFSRSLPQVWRVAVQIFGHDALAGDIGVRVQAALLPFG
jgi:hypothetical protein